MSIDFLKTFTESFFKFLKRGDLVKYLLELRDELIDSKIKILQQGKKISDLEEELRKLKGGNRRPKFGKHRTNVDSKDLDDTRNKKHKKVSKNSNIEIDQEVELRLDRDELPKDAKYVGKRAVIVQDLKFVRLNTKYWIYRYWCEKENKVFESSLPEKTAGFYGVGIRVIINYFYYKLRVPHLKIRDALLEMGITISKGSIEGLLNNQPPELYEELEGLKMAGLKREKVLYMDDTGHFFKNKSAHTFTLSHNDFTYYWSGITKGREQVFELLCTRYCLNQEALGWIRTRVSNEAVLKALEKLVGPRDFGEEELDAVLKARVPKFDNDLIGKMIRQGCRYGSLRKCYPRLCLITDDAPNFKHVTPRHQLCWVHEIRKYRTLDIGPELSLSVKDIVSQWKFFYRRLKSYQRNPTPSARKNLEKLFDNIVGQRTLVSSIDSQLERTKLLKKNLLLVLKYPGLPLHTNMAERDLRERVIKRKISLGNRSAKGMRAWDLMLSLVSSCRKLGQSYWKFLYDRYSEKESIPYLGQIAFQK